MGAIHELREEYRFYRAEHPQYRWLFGLADIAGLLIKLAVFGGFLFLCWYIVSRGPQTEQPLANVAQVPPSVDAAAETPATELTAERLALLRKIAGQEAVPTEELIGSVDAADRSTAGTQTESAPGVNSETSNTVLVADQPVVQVASLTTGLTASAGYLEIDEIPTVMAVTGTAGESPAEFTDKVSIPDDVENGAWLLNQDAGDYTVQLALTVNFEFLVSYAKKLPSEYVAAIYPERLNNRGDIQYSLSAGSFPNQRSAEAALASLPDDLKRYGAHIRKFEEAQSKITAFLR